MDNSKKLSHTAYGGVAGEDYVPFIATTTAMPELSIYSILMGVLFSMIFAAANTYLGLKVGLTIAAGIPGAILATGILKGAFKRNNILEANMVASIAAVGESIAGGIIYILPAIILWGFDLKVSTIVIVTLLGGLVGIFFVTPLRKFLIVEEHGNLVYPESMAAAEVLVNGSEGGSGFRMVLMGLGIGGGYKLASGGFALWSERPEWVITQYQGAVFGIDTLASLLGVGFIVGTKASAFMFGGAVVAWLGLIPLIKYIGSGLTQPLFPSTELISEMGASAIWSKYIRYIGAGAVAAGGFISLGKSAPTIIKSFKSAMAGIGKKDGGTVTRINEEPPITWVIASAIIVFILSWILPQIRAGVIGSLMAVVFSFFFGVVSARMVGIIGASNNPVSGMTIATLLFVTATLKVTGQIGDSGMILAVMIGGIVCVAIAVAGGTAQSLKTTFVIGGSPKKVQIGMYIGLVFGAVVSGYVLLMLHNTYGIGSEAVPAPQATLMSMVIQGVMTGELPWALVFVGVSIAVFTEICGLPVLPVALGLYLPIHLSAGILSGGIIRIFVEKRFKKDESVMKDKVERGILISSGLVAGDALMGIVVAGFATFGLDVAFGLNFAGLTQNSIFSTAIFIALGVVIYLLACGGDKQSS
ncbi:oligopeptide transporter, OPT family [Clostridium sp.]|uniref:OPT family oligopeptide transporter n=1 Tax=Clostridium sp. TaxID=1506 RepID=UPI003216BF9C